MSQLSPNSSPSRIEIEDAMWSGDQDTLHELAPCGCCCEEHTSARCPARAWNGCRGQVFPPQVSEDEWAAFYARTRGMTPEQFFGMET